MSPTTIRLAGPERAATPCCGAVLVTGLETRGESRSAYTSLLRTSSFGAASTYSTPVLSPGPLNSTLSDGGEVRPWLAVAQPLATIPHVSTKARSHDRAVVELNLGT
jgi:hypothetical protein